LSRGSSPASYPAEPLVSYQINRQLSGWHLPPLVIRAFGAHGQNRPSSVALLAMAREQLTPKVSINKLRLDERRILRPHGGLLSPHL
jgi:hypothetical protein